LSRKGVFAEKHFKVIDNFLSETQHRELYNHFKDLPFQFVHSEKKIPAFKLTDGNPLWADPVLSHAYTKNGFVAYVAGSFPKDYFGRMFLHFEMSSC
jgi:hypothetical protein